MIDGPILANSMIGICADIVDDLETVRVANENRLRQLTDPSELGHGLTIDNPDVRNICALVAGMYCKSAVLKDLGWTRPPKQRGQSCCLECSAILNLQHAVRKHPLGTWVKETNGVGEKQAGRLLAVLRDPYWNDLYDRPRGLRELYAYCGMSVVNGSAPKRQRGERINWNPEARKRLWLVASKCVQITSSPYRRIYEEGRAQYAEAVHPEICVRCGPKSKPAQPGTPLSAGHQDARARRLIAKAILRDLWERARELHGAAEEIAA